MVFLRIVIFFSSFDFRFIFRQIFTCELVYKQTNIKYVQEQMMDYPFLVDGCDSCFALKSDSSTGLNLWVTISFYLMSQEEC